MQAVGNLDEYDAYVVAHHEQQFLEGFRLQRGFFAEYASRNLRDPFHYVGNLGSEEIGEVLVGVVRVLLHVVEQRGADGGGAEADFAAGNLRHGDGVEDVRFARAAAHALVSLFGKVECFRDEVYLAAVVSGKVSVEQALKSCVDHLFVFLFLRGQWRV